MPRVVLGVCGGIAAYKAVEVCRQLVDAGVHVAPVLTEDAQQFIDMQNTMNTKLRVTADAKEALAAFIEKRPARFTNA